MCFYRTLYLKPLAENLPSFIKDTRYLISKINEVSQKGPFPPGALLVSWDVVAMFPNIDNKLGFTAVKNALIQELSNHHLQNASSKQQKFV